MTVIVVPWGRGVRGGVVRVPEHPGRHEHNRRALAAIDAIVTTTGLQRHPRRGHHGEKDQQRPRGDGEAGEVDAEHHGILRGPAAPPALSKGVAAARGCR